MILMFASDVVASGAFGLLNGTAVSIPASVWILRYSLFGIMIPRYPLSPPPSEHLFLYALAYSS